jgi:hypothetical protein
MVLYCYASRKLFCFNNLRREINSPDSQFWGMLNFTATLGGASHAAGEGATSDSPAFWSV